MYSRDYTRLCFIAIVLLKGSVFEVYYYFYSSLNPNNMKKLCLISVFALLFSASMFAQKQVVGKWLTEKKDAITEIYEQSGKFYGKIIWLKKPTDNTGKPVKDVKNPTASFRQRSVMGLVVINGLSFSNKEWSDGSVYDPASGKTYTCKIWLTDNNTLNIRGYIGFLHSTEVWTRVK
jgi:uncharacterized protein (DUF2147 family)